MLSLLIIADDPIAKPTTGSGLLGAPARQAIPKSPATPKKAQQEPVSKKGTVKKITSKTNGLAKGQTTLFGMTLPVTPKKTAKGKRGPEKGLRALLGEAAVTPPSTPKKSVKKVPKTPSKPQPTLVQTWGIPPPRPVFEPSKDQASKSPTKGKDSKKKK